MADVYAMITDADPALVDRIAEVLELRAADPQQAAMRRAYLGDVAFPEGADALEAAGRIGHDTAAVLKAEAHRRVADGGFFGHIAYASLVATHEGPPA